MSNTLRHNPNYLNAPDYLLRRRVAAMASLGLLAATGFGLYKGVEAIGDTAPRTEQATELYKVEPGDNPWDIAKDTLGPENEIRPLVQDIVEQSDNDGQPGLQPGEVIELPSKNNQ